MGYQSEKELEEILVNQLISLGYEKVAIRSKKDLESNLKFQLEKFNNINLTNSEFVKVLNHLNNGDIFDKAKILRDKFALLKDDNKVISYIDFLNSEHWCQNLFQVAQQIQIGLESRYDVTILINGLPLVQIELKRRGLELKEAFNQVNRYHKGSYRGTLFDYIQIFIISNGINTKYYSNDSNLSFEQTFFWSNVENERINNLDEFTSSFLERCHLAKIICKYIVLAENNRKLMVLRPYQYYAVEAIVDRVKNTDKNGYIWHTTGSGKTLTSFKASQILVKLSKVYKVVFVVDRRDLDYQTIKEFNSFSQGSVDGTNNTRILIDQFLNRYTDDKGEHKKTDLIVTTIQKLNIAISNENYLKDMEDLRDKKIVFIFDECHRSQFGKTHANIIRFFKNTQLIGFTGTPIFEENSDSNHKNKTTHSLFNDILHKYVIIDAIGDNMVLKFSIEYVFKYQRKNLYEIDEKVTGIDTREFYESKDRIEKIVNYILENHDRKTYSRKYTAMMCVSSIEVLCKYYEMFRNKDHKLKIATIFSYSSKLDNNEDTTEEDEYYINEGLINESYKNKLEEYIKDYNKILQENQIIKTPNDFYNYYNNISKNVKECKIDILLVVNMFLTGFDSKRLNTIYVDKNLKYHGLLQAYSRTNRIYDVTKSHGNVVCFRDLKRNTDEAITLFSNKEVNGIITFKPYKDYVKRFDEEVGILLKIAPTQDKIDKLKTDEEKKEFIIAFRDIIRTKNIMESFSEFKWSDIRLMTEQDFENYKTKYLDLYDEVRKPKGNKDESILNDINFEPELIHKDEINVSYILKLLAKCKIENNNDKLKYQEEVKKIMQIIQANQQLRSKKELIEKFINTTLKEININELDKIEEKYEDFIEYEKNIEAEKLSKEENLDQEKLNDIIKTYQYDGISFYHKIEEILLTMPPLLQLAPRITKIYNRIMYFYEKFIDK